MTRNSAKAKREFWVQTVMVLLVGGVLVAAFAWSASQPLNAIDLAIAAGDLRSLCSAGQQLSGQVSAGNLTDAFAHSQLELMHDNVTSNRDSIDTADAEPTIQEQLSQVRALAAKVDGEFGHLSEEPGDHAVAEELSGLAEQLSEIEKELKAGADK